MWRSKKLIIIALVAAVILVGSIGGVALAVDNRGNSQPQASANVEASSNVTVWDRVATILKGNGVNVTSEQLKTAFTKAQGELQTEGMQKRLQSMVEQGTITQQQADAYLNWWKTKPDVPAGFGFKGHGGFRGMGGMMGRMGTMHGAGYPTTPAQ